MLVVSDFVLVHLIISALTGYAWIVLIASIVFHFRHPIRDMLGRMTALKSAGFEMTMGSPSASNTSTRNVEYETEPKRGLAEVTAGATDTGEPDTVVGSARMSHLNLYHWYWLGHDLMYTQDLLLRGGDDVEEYILYGIRQSLAHWDALGVKSEEVRNRLLLVYEKGERLAKSTWTNDDRREAFAVLQGVKLDVGFIASRIADAQVKQSEGFELVV